MQYVKGNTFGRMIRAARNCFYYSQELSAYVRMSWRDIERGIVEVEVCTPYTIPGRGRQQEEKEYIVWSDLKTEDGKELISLLKLPGKGFDSYHRYFVDGEGNVVDEPAPSSRQ